MVMHLVVLEALRGTAGKSVGSSEVKTEAIEAWNNTEGNGCHPTQFFDLLCTH
jgi:hypothetical protein